MIRVMLESDLDRITALEREHQPHPWPRAAFEQALRLNQNCKVFEVDQVVYTDSGIGTQAHILGYGVANGGHGRTIYASTIEAADALYRSWFDYAFVNGVPELWAQIEPENHAARVRLQRFGFEKVGVVPSLYGPGIDAEVWRKRTQEYKADKAIESA